MITKTELIEIAKNAEARIKSVYDNSITDIDEIIFTRKSIQAFAKEIRNRTIDECKNEAIAQYKTNSQYNGRYIAECIENLKEFNSAKELSDYLKSEVTNETN